MKKSLRELLEDQKFIDYLNDLYSKSIQGFTIGDYVGDDFLFFLVTNQALNKSYRYRYIAVKFLEASSYRMSVVGDFLRNYYQIKINSHYEISKTLDVKIKELVVSSLLGDVLGVGFQAARMAEKFDGFYLQTQRRSVQGIYRKTYRKIARMNVKRLKEIRREQKLEKLFSTLSKLIINKK
jgi:hypothetical protein